MKYYDLCGKLSATGYLSSNFHFERTLNLQITEIYRNYKKCLNSKQVRRTKSIWSKIGESVIYKCGKGEIPDLSRKISRGGGKFQGFSRHRIMVCEIPGHVRTLLYKGSQV